MIAQYDDIAEQYQEFRNNAGYYRIIEYTFLHYLGDVRGKSMLDLACGEGGGARKFKQLGANQVVGVDVSKEMLELAVKQETQDPLGIEYICSPIQELGKIGDFDVVTAVFLLHYAPTKEELLKMCKAVYDNLKLGERFITANNNIKGNEADYLDPLKKYGFGRIEFSKPLQEGAVINITLTTDNEELQFHNYYYSRETYEWALKTAGFKSIRWHKLILPPEMEEQNDKEFWKFFLEASQVIILECQK